jgi:hypothetical protein
MDSPPAGVVPEQLSGTNWALVSNRLVRDGPSLVHRDEVRDADALAFRGYVLDPPLHSWSQPEPLLNYWRSPRTLHNGVFAAARIADSGRHICLVTDAFGMSPLYWRRLPIGLVLFSTSARYLRVADDVLDEYSARMFMHRGALAGNAALIKGVERVTPGVAIHFRGDAVTPRAWFDWTLLPPGVEQLADEHVEVAEQAFQTAVDRCLALMPDRAHNLPLSSGDDSRRILAALHSRGSRFRAMTVRVLQKENRDLDARFASEMAARIGFDHEVLELEGAEQFGRDDAACRKLFSSEISEHGWIGPLVRRLGSGQSLVFDGVAGDIFGNTGYARRDLYALSGTQDLQRIAELATPVIMSDVLRSDAWAPLADVRSSLASWLELLPENANRPDLAFLLVRARRGTGPCMQQTLPPGHVAVCPYLDLDHAMATLRAHPVAKLEQTLQARCLERYWPEYYAVPGSRRFAAAVPQQSTEMEEARRLARIRRLASEAPSVALPEMFAKVRLRNAAVASLGLVSESLLLRASWWLDPLLMLQGFAGQNVVCEVVTS